MQLKDIIEGIGKLFAIDNGAKAKELLGENVINYHELISQEDFEFW